jgi:PAS domain S-box-containing protein
MPKYLRMSRLKLSVMIPFVGFVLVLALSVAAIEHRKFRRESTRISVEINAAIDTSFGASVTSEAAALRSVAEAVANDRTLMAAFRQRDRGRVLDLTSGLFKRLNHVDNLTHFYFIDPEHRSFLRVHDPDRHGDPISRHTMLAAERTRAPAHGIELGPLGTLTLRVVVPWFDGDDLLGYIETGKEIDHLFDDLRQQFDLHPMVFLPKARLDRQGWEQGMAMLGRPAHWGEFDDVVLSIRNGIPAEVIRPFLTGQADNVEAGGRWYTWLRVNVPDASGMSAASIGLVRDVTASHDEIVQMGLIIGAIALTGSIVVILVFWLVIDRVEAVLMRTRDDLAWREALYHSLFSGARIAMLLTDQSDGTIVDANEEACRFYGYDAPRLRALRITDINALSPTEVEAEMARASKQSRNHFHFRHRLASGEVREVEVHSGLIEVKGRMLLYSVIHDVTERRRLEAERKRLVMAIEQSPVSIVIADKDARVEYVNPAFTSASGYSLEEAVGQNPRILKSGETSDEEYRDMWSVLSSGKPWSGIFHNKRKSGEFYWEHAHISPVVDKDGHITHYIGIKEDVSDRLRAEEVIKTLNRRLQQVLAAASEVAIIAVDTDGIITMFNRGAENLLGYRADDVVSKHKPSLFHEPEDFAEISGGIAGATEGRMGAIFARIEREGAVQGELAYIRKDGTRFIGSAVFTSLQSEDGTVTGFLGVVHDVTARKRSEMLTEARLRLTHIAATCSLHDLLVATLDEACAMTGAAIGNYHFLMPDQITLSLQAWSSGTTAEFCLALPESHHYDLDAAGIWADAVRQGRAVVCNDHPSAPGCQGLPDGQAEVKRLISVPIFRDGSIKAVIGVGNKPAPFDDGDTGIIEALADLAWDITERKRAEERLKDSEARFRSLIEGTTDWVWESDENHCFTWVSPSFETILGLSSATLIGKRRWDLASEHHEIDPARWEGHIADLTAHRGFRDFRYWIHRPNDSAKWVSVSGAPRFTDDGRFLGYRGSGSDVTHFGNISLRLRTMVKVVEQSPVSVVITDTTGQITYVNPHFTSVTGYAGDEVIGQNSRMLSSGQTALGIYEELWRTITSGKTWSGEFKNRKKDGSLHWEQAVIFPVTNEEGRLVHFVSIKEDVTARKEADARLVEQMRLTQHHYESLRALSDIAALRSADASMMLTEALALGCRHLELPVGIISHIGGQSYTVRHHQAPDGAPLADGQVFDLGNTYCAITLATGDVVAIPYMGQSTYSGHPCYQAFGLEAYLGAPVTVRGKHFGTVNFSSASPYGREFDDGDLEFMRLLARWVGAVLERGLAEQDVRDALEAVEQARQRTDLLLSSAGEGIFGVDTAGCLTFINPAGLRMLGYADKTEVIGSPSHAITSHTLADGAPCSESQCAVVQTLEDGVPRHCDSDHFGRRDGPAFPVHFSVTPIVEGGAIIGAVVIFHDISDRRMSENALAEAFRQIKRQADELAHINAELEQFAYVASHDLRQPLRMISSYMSLIERKAGDHFDDDLRKFFAFAVDGAKRMDGLILGLLDYSRTGRNAGPFEEVSLAEAVTESLNNLEVAIEESGAEIVVADDLPTVDGYRTDLVRLFQNLIGNAIKYRTPNRVPKVEIGWHAEGGERLAWVKDNGIGIEPDHFDRAFQIFQRLVTKEEYEGSGLGLAICKKIVGNHGGRIWIESTVGEGTTFFVAFPKASSGKQERDGQC